jgi:hypothetical protein
MYTTQVNIHPFRIQSTPIFPDMFWSRIYEVSIWLLLDNPIFTQWRATMILWCRSYSAVRQIFRMILKLRSLISSPAISDSVAEVPRLILSGKYWRIAWNRIKLLHRQLSEKISAPTNTRFGERYWYSVISPTTLRVIYRLSYFNPVGDQSRLCGTIVRYVAP